MASSLPDGSRSGHSPGNWFWGGFIVIILIGVLLALFAAVRGTRQWVETRLEQAESLPPAWSEVVRVTLTGGNEIDIDPLSLPAIRAESQNWIEQQHLLAQQQILSTAGIWQESVILPLLRFVPAYGDWYYSLKGEYQRLLHAAMGDLPLFVAQQLETRLFQPAGTEESIVFFRQGLNREVTAQLSETAEGVQNLIIRLVKSHRRTTSGDAQVRVVGDWRLDNQSHTYLAPFLELTPEDLTRQGFASGAGMAAAATAMKKLGAATMAKVSVAIAGQSGSGAVVAAAGKLGAKSAAKAAGGSIAGVAAGAASGVALCSATLIGVPLIPGCALVGGVITGLATWLVVDKAILEADELLNREAFEADLRQVLSSELSELHDTFQSEYMRLVDMGFDRLRTGLDQSLLPVHRIPTMDFIPARAADHSGRVESTNSTTVHR